MVKKYKLELLTKKEIKESVIYYEERKEGLGGEFLDELNLKIVEIKVTKRFEMKEKLQLKKEELNYKI